MQKKLVWNHELNSTGTHVLLTFTAFEHPDRGTLYYKYDDDHYFRASNGFRVKSYDNPGLIRNCIFVPGFERGMDDKTVSVPVENWSKVLQALNEFKASFESDVDDVVEGLHFGSYKTAVRTLVGRLLEEG